MSQLPDGRWVPAHSIPYYRDSRPFWVKIGHCCLALRGCFIRDAEQKEAYFDRLEERTDKWMVPVEPYTNKDGKWCHW
jgi:hypothetical protein